MGELRAATPRRKTIKLAPESPARDHDLALACEGEDPELFFLEDPSRLKEAKAVCGRCPARTKCLAFALAHETRSSRWGIWGGLTPLEREQVAGGAA